MTEPITSQQDHDRRIGRLEGIAEQLDRRLESIERRMDRIERSLAEFSRRIDSLTRWTLAGFFCVVGLLVSILLKLN